MSERAISNSRVELREPGTFYVRVFLIVAIRFTCVNIWSLMRFWLDFRVVSTHTRGYYVVNVDVDVIANLHPQNVTCWPRLQGLTHRNW